MQRYTAALPTCQETVFSWETVLDSRAMDRRALLAALAATVPAAAPPRAPEAAEDFSEDPVRLKADTTDIGSVRL
ncbi:MAG: hypothetical protein DMF88_05195 [Acidobacteria bacterium]|nr:MAG: hypothetical protein DMF88_05195 [Acidobacteriota bacterium]